MASQPSATCALLLATPTELELKLAGARSKMELLLFFECQCRRVKLYDLQSTGARYGTRLKLVRETTNLQDPLNCVAAWVPGPWVAVTRHHLCYGTSQKGQPGG